MHRLFKDYYAPFILRKEVKLISSLIYILYVCVSFYGCSNMRVDISPKKYIRDNSPIQTFVHLAGMNKNKGLNRNFYNCLKTFFAGN